MVAVPEFTRERHHPRCLACRGSGRGNVRPLFSGVAATAGTVSCIPRVPEWNVDPAARFSTSDHCGMRPTVPVAFSSILPAMAWFSAPDRVMSGSDRQRRCHERADLPPAAREPDVLGSASSRRPMRRLSTRGPRPGVPSAQHIVNVWSIEPTGAASQVGLGGCGFDHGRMGDAP